MCANDTRIGPLLKKLLDYNIWNIRIAPFQNPKNDIIYGCILIIIVQTYR